MKVLRKKLKNPNCKYFLSENLNGFTLIEVLVVVSIIGILVTAFLTSIIPARTKAKDVAFKETVSSIDSAAVLCCSSSGSPFLNAAEPNTGNINICDPDINSIYPGETQIMLVKVDSNCTNDKFSITLFPGTLNFGNCQKADCTEDGCIYVGC